MLIKFEHPVIVSGEWTASSRPRHELVRTVSEFDIKTFHSDDVPVSFTFSGNETTRSVDGRLFTRSPHIEDNPANPFAPSSLGIHMLLFAGGIEAFDPIWRMVKDEAETIRRENMYRAVENLERTPLQKELRSGHNKWSIACVKAPVLKKWKWLSPDTDAEVAAWKARIAQLLDNVILVDGTPYVRTAEPRIQLVRARADQAHAFVRTKPYYTRQAHIHERELSGLHRMPDDAFNMGSHHFGLAELEKMEAVADTLGWKVGTDLSDIDIIDPDALTLDHTEMEKARHARIALDRGTKMLMIHRYQTKDTNLGGHPAYASMEEALNAQQTSILDWQDQRGDIDAVSADYASLVREITEFPIAENEVRDPRVFDLLDQFESFETRLDAEPVHFKLPIPGM